MAANKKGGGGGPKIHSSHHGDVFKVKAGGKRSAPSRSARSARPRPGGGGRGDGRPRGPGAKKAKLGPQPAHGGSSVASEDARALAITIAVAALEKKAVGLEILDVAGKVDYADFLVIMTGRSDRQVSALAQAIEEALKRKGVRALAVEGLPHASWVLMDFGDVVVHVFQDDARNLYDIEGLWLDARRLPVPAPGPDELR